MTTLSFDRVVVVGVDGLEREYSVEEFLTLPIHDRVRQILERRLRFYLRGDVVDQTEALKSMRR